MGAADLSDDFTRQKMEWLGRVHRDRRLSPSCFQVAFAVAGYINRQSLEAWPAQDRLADDCGMTRSGLRKALYALRDAGHLIIDAAHGRGTSSRYRWTDRPAMGKGENCPDEDTISQKVPDTGHYQQAEKCPERGKESVPAVATNTMNEHFEFIPSPATDVALSISAEPAAGLFGADERSATVTGKPRAGGKSVPLHAVPRGSRALAHGTGDTSLSRKTKGHDRAALDEGFQRFRAAYPKRKGDNWSERSPAFKAYQRAVKSGANPDEIVSGAAAYAAHMIREGNTGERARYIKMAATWLNASDWEADYAPASSASATPQQSPSMTDDQWRKFVARYQTTKSWPAEIGPRPGAAGCLVPLVILRELGAA